jgi:hypothetical protein
MTLARNKSWGYECETQALEALRPLWPTAERTGASNQKVADDPDIISRGRTPFCIVVTKEKGSHRPLLVHLTADDFIQIATLGVGDNGLAVQVKGRANLWVNTLLYKLRARANASWDRWWSQTGEKSEARTILQMQREARGL